MGGKAQQDEFDIIEDEDELQDELVDLDDKSASAKHDEDDDTRLGIADEEDDTDEQREAIKERRRTERKERAERRKKAAARDRIELDYLRQQNDSLERRVAGMETNSRHVELRTIDQEYNKALADAKTAERVIEKAIEAKNGADVTKAMTLRDQAMRRAEALRQEKQRREAPQQRAPAMQQPAQPQLGANAARHAEKFIKENAWWDPNGGDEDSAIVSAIDATLFREGYDPESEDYWEELRERTAKRLPDRFAPAKGKTPGTGGPQLGSGRSASTGRKEVRISPARKQAMMEAGVWEDPVLRAKYVKRYAEYDREHAKR